LGSARPRIGYACLWDEIPQRTWSYTAWNLRAGMQHAGDLVDVGVQIPSLPRTILKAIHTRLSDGRLTTNWAYSRLTDAYSARLLHRGLDLARATGGCDAVLTVQDLAALPIPFFTYQDVSYDALIAARTDTDKLADLLALTSTTVARRRERQLAIYERATGVIAMSRWFAKTLVNQTGLVPEKVHVVHPGLSAGWALQGGNTSYGMVGSGSPAVCVHERKPPRRRLLFVGNDFYRKGGDLVVEALALLRRDYDSRITLTVVGPKHWPQPGGPPDGVRFLGSLPSDEVACLYESHDLFVMPSRLEPFGVVFAEAIARGVPCIARDAYAMPEIVIPGLSGALVTGDDVSELATVIADCLANDMLYAKCYENAPDAAAYFSWERAGREVVDVITRALRSDNEGRVRSAYRTLSSPSPQGSAHQVAIRPTQDGMTRGDLP
jgi:glycosyltransferase involved in cell wall biosynthesis